MCIHSYRSVELKTHAPPCDVTCFPRKKTRIRAGCSQNQLRFTKKMSLLLLNLLGTPGGPTIRGQENEGVDWFSVYDFATKMCKYQDKGNTARKEFSRLTQDGCEYQQEVASLCRYLKFPGSGQRETPCMTIRGLQRYLMILGGKVAAEFREIVEGTFTRVMAGDKTLIEVINANAVSQAPIQQAYRAALEQEPVAPVLDDYCLKRRREREDLLFDMEMAERKLAFEEKRRLHDLSLIEDTAVAMKAINDLKDWANVDERTKMQAEDHIKNVLFKKLTSNQACISDGTSTTQSTDALNVSILAKELGFKCSDAELQRIGREMAKKYRETYKSDPPKHKQYVGGNFIPINSYMERDRPLMELAIRSVMI